jgi:hypothetical protein
MMIVSKPQASQRVIVSRVFLATPPSVSPAEGRMYAFSSLTNSVHAGFISQNTAVNKCTAWINSQNSYFCPIQMFSKRFNERTFPTPGTPVIPIRIDLFA